MVLNASFLCAVSLVYNNMLQVVASEALNLKLSLKRQTFRFVPFKIIHFVMVTTVAIFLKGNTNFWLCLLPICNLTILLSIDVLICFVSPTWHQICSIRFGHVYRFFPIWALDIVGMGLSDIWTLQGTTKKTKNSINSINSISCWIMINNGNYGYFRSFINPELNIFLC